VGSIVPTPCSPGYYCGNFSGLISGPCSAGYFCAEVSQYC
jgi:hypothetical protein